MTLKQSKGVYYGYPKCCILAFHDMLRNEIKFNDISPERKNTTKHGFVPCQRCAEKILSGFITIEDLISPTRECPRPFSKRCAS